MIDKSLLLSKKPMIIIGILVSIIIIIGGYLYYTSERDSFRKEKYNELKAISGLKINQILEWRKERIADVKVTTQSVFLLKAIAHWITNRDNPILKEEMKERLGLTQKEFGYEDICITNTKGEFLLSVVGNTKGIDSIIKQDVIKTAEKRKIIFSDFFRCPIDGKEHLAISSPLILDNEVFAVMVFIIDPNEYIYPLIQSWPTPSESAETLLLRKDGDSVLILNELRHWKNTALELRIPLTEEEISAVQAVLGYEGIFEGKDYRGEDVLTDIEKIPDTPWYMIAKVDQSEIYGPLRAKTFAIAGFFMLLIFLLSIGLAFIYNFRQSDSYKELYLKEKELDETQEVFRTTLYSIGDGVITTDTLGRIRHMNHVAEELTGWREFDATGKPLEEVFKILNEDTGDKVENPVDKILREGVVIGLANHTILIHKKGKQIPIADSGTPIHDENKNIKGVVLVFRDQTEEREHQKTLQESEEFIRRIIASSNDCIKVLDLEGNLLSMSEGGQKIFEIDDINIYLNKSWVDYFWKGKDREDALEAISKAKNDDVGMFTGYCETEKGTPKWWEIIITPIKDSHGNINRLLSISRDITERKKAEEELQGTRDYLENLINYANAPIIVWDNRRKITLFNNAFEKLSDYKRDEVLGKDLDILFFPLEKDVILKTIASAIKGEHWEIVEIPIKCKNGNRRIVLWNSANILDKDNVISTIAQGQDITERKQAEKQLIQAKTEWEETVNTISDMITVHDKDFNIIRANQAAEKLLKLPILDVIPGTKCFRYFHGKEAPPEGCPSCNCLQTGLPATFELFESHLGMFIEVSAFPRFDSKHRLTGLIHVVRDITERKKAELEILNSRDQLQNLSSHLQTIREEERGVIAREIHDDLGQSLTALKMDMSFFEKHLHEGDDSSEKKIKGMIELVDETVKSVQRISTELRPGVLDDIGFSAAVSWFMSEFEERSGLKCQLYIKPDDIVLDEKLSIAMYRIFQESLTNIMRHAKATEVKVNIKLIKNKLSLVVEDNGVGIDEEKLKDPKSIGLIGMQERVYPWRGTVEITGEKGKGTIVQVNVKL